MSELVIDGLPWHAETDLAAGPAAPALVLVHGASANLHIWDTVVDALRPHFRLYRMDLLGHGRSAKPDDRSRYSIPGWAAGVLACLDHWDVERAVLLGHSLGGMVALEFALTWPDRLTGLGLLNTTPGPLQKTDADFAREEALVAFVESQGLAAAFEQARQLNPYAERHHDLPGGAAQVREQFLLNTVESYVHTRYAMRTKPRHTPRLAEIAVPTAVFISERDETFQPAAEILAAKIPDAATHVIPDAGHTPQLENPPAAAEILRRGLRALVDAAPTHGRPNRIRRPA